MGGGTTINQPSPPPQPSTADAVNAWVKAMPQVYETQLKYAPMEAQQQLELLQKYATPLGQAMYDAQAAMYPETAKLQEQLATQASEGMEQGIPDSEKSRWEDYYKANLGTNVGSDIGSIWQTSQMMSKEKEWQDYYRNLGLSVAGRQPLASPASPGYSNYMSGFTPNANMNYMSSTYAPYAGAYSSMYNTNSQMAQYNSSTPFRWMSGIGGLMKGVGGMAGGFGFGQG